MTLRWHKIFPDGNRGASVKRAARDRGGRISNHARQSGGGVGENAAFVPKKIMSKVYDEHVNSSEIIAFEPGEGNSHF